MFTVVMQEGKGASSEEDEEEMVTPRDLWSQVPRKSTFSLEIF